MVVCQEQEGDLLGARIDCLIYCGKGWWVELSGVDLTVVEKTWFIEFQIQRWREL